jgi:hypothetical protein
MNSGKKTVVAEVTRFKATIMAFKVSLWRPKTFSIIFSLVLRSLEVEDRLNKEEDLNLNNNIMKKLK